MKKILLQVLFVTLAFTSVMAQNRGEVSDEFKGDGTAESPYLISTAADLRKLADDVEEGMTYRGEYFLLVKNIAVNNGVLDADGKLNEEKSMAFEQWKPIGTERTHFCGTFDGAHHAITGLYINQNEEEENKPAALFGYLSGTVKNLTIKDSYFCGNSYIGSIAGVPETVTINKKDYSANIMRCLNYATMEFHSNNSKISCGGICGIIGESCTISKCANFGRIYGYNKNTYYDSTGYCRIGGIVGGINIMANKVSISDCCNMGNLECDINTYVYGGGIVGKLDGYSNIIINCVNHSPVNISRGKGYVAGILCDGMYTSLDGCVNYGKISHGDDYKAGGIVAMLAAYYFLRNNAYLETSCEDFCVSAGGRNNNSDGSNNKVMTKSEMRQPSFLDELNSNAAKLGKEYSKWVFGSDGYPTLEWVGDEILSDIGRISAMEGKGNTDFTNNIYNLKGQLIRANSRSTDGLPRGIYIVNGKKLLITK